MRKIHRKTFSHYLYKLMLLTTIVSLGIFGGSVPPASALLNQLPLGNVLARVQSASAAGEGEWTQEGHDAQHSGYTAEEPGQPWSLAWTWNGPDANGGTGGHIYNAPPDAHTVTGGSFVYAPAGSAGLFAINKSDGAQAWRLTAATFNATPAYDPATGSLYAGGADGRLYKINSTNGQVQGTYSAGAGINKAVVLVGSDIYLTTDNGELHKVNTGSMTQTWRYAANAPLATPAAYSASAGVLVFATEDLYVHAVRASDGSAVWRVKPTSHEAVAPYTFSGFWPVIAEQHGIVFVRLNLGFGALYSGTLTGTSGGGVYPMTNQETRNLLLANNGALENLFALDLSNGSKKFVPAVGYGATELRTSSTADGLFLVAPPVPVVKVNSDGSEVAYIAFRSGQGSPPDGRWDSHMGEMVLDGSTISGLQAGDLRFMDFPDSYVHITDEQTPFTMAGNVLFQAHWGASQSTRITDRSAGRGLTHDNPITSSRLPIVIRRQASCSDFNPTTHQTSCFLNLYGDGRGWPGPGFWTYWNVWDPPTPIGQSYSDGVKPRYTYVSSGLTIVEGNGGELMALRSGAAPSPTNTPAPSRYTPTPSQGGDWVFCADEGGSCTVPGTTQVRFGANGSYNYQTVTGTVACTTAVFGDPLQYTVKTCEYLNPSATSAPTTAPTIAPTTAPTTAPTATRVPPTATRAVTNTPLPTVPPTATRLPTNAPTPAQSGTWVHCANENETCNVPGTVQVRYGANSLYNYLTVTNSVVCSNDVFGDPVFGSPKSCDYLSGGATSVPTNAPTTAPTATRAPTSAPTATAVPPQPTTAPNGDYLTLDTYEDFNQTCAVFSTTHASDRNSGVVELGAQLVDQFNTTTISTTRWKIAAVGAGSYSASDASGILSVGPNTYLQSKTTLSRSILETTAQFDLAAGQSLGFVGSLTTGKQYFLFTTHTGDGNLYALANNGGTDQLVNLGPVLSGMHRYRIEWRSENSTTDSAAFFVDGAEKAKLLVSNASITGWTVYMKNTGSSTIKVDNIQSAPAYVASGTYTTCPLDAGVGRTWSNIAWNREAPTNTSVVVKTRSSADGKTWGSWYTVSASGKAITGAKRFVQVNVVLRTSVKKSTSLINSITVQKIALATPTNAPTVAPTRTPTQAPTTAPTTAPSLTPTRTPTRAPTTAPTTAPTATRAATSTPASAGPTPTPAQAGTWVFCANEGENCTFSGTAQVRYGANNSYNYQTATGSIACTNAVFGDPIPFTVKTCSYLSGATSVPTTAPTAPPATNTPAPVGPTPTQPGPTPTALPPSTGRISSVKVVAGSPAVYEKFEVQFSVQTSATTLDLPYDANPPAGMQAGTGITVNGLFSNDNWATTITQPAFLYQPYTAKTIDNKDHLTPAGAPVWSVRFAPQKSGSWQYRLSVQDSQGTTIYPAASQPALTFNVGAASSSPYTKKGFVNVSPADKRYFQFSDGSPFIASGFNDGFSSSPSSVIEQRMVAYEQNKMNLMRVWMSGSGINGTQWPAWANNFLPMDAYLPGVSFDTANTYNGSTVSMRLDDANPCVYADFWRGGVPVEPNTQYTFTIRLKTNNITGPAASGDYGFVAKQAGWLDKDCVKGGNGVRLTAPVSGSRDWTEVTGTYNSGSSESWMGGLYLARENATGGQVYIDEVHLYRTSDPNKVDILRQPYADATEHFDTMSAAQWDMYIQSAEKHGVYLKLVVDEKNEWIRNHMGADGKMTAAGDNNNFYAAPNTKVRWLAQAWWRYIIARWGYSTAIHSLEYVNEGDPYNGNHYDAAGAMATYFKQNDPSNHMVTTSFWHSFPNSEFWSNPQYADIAYADVHAYISTGWGLDASFIPDSMKETNAAYVHSGKGSARLPGNTDFRQSIVPRGGVIQGQGEWVIKYWMKASNLTATCGYNSTGTQMRVRWMLDGGTYGGGVGGVVPANSEAKDFLCSSPGGTFDWRQFTSLTDRDGNALPETARIIVKDNNPHWLDLAIENYGGTGGTAWIDDVQLISPTGQVQPVIGTFETTLLKEDTAWSNIAYGSIFGGGSLMGARKPLIRGETGLDDGTTYDPDQVKDTKGIWLHNNVWAQMSAGGIADLFWWATETIPQSIYSNYLTYENFMAGIPLTNGRYKDSGATASHPDLRVVGQRDDTAGQMHLWIQNTQHSWRRAVNGPAISAVTGTVTIPGVASGSYKVEWWNTYAASNPVIKTETLSANGNLVLTLPSALSDDIAVKITKVN